MTIGARLRYAKLLHMANVDDDVKVLVIRGVGDDFGTGADLPELAALQEQSTRTPPWRLNSVSKAQDVTFPPPRSYRGHATLPQWYADARSGCRTLAEFKKISIVEVKGYCYGWHFYQAADADLVIAVGRCALRPSRVPLCRLGSADVGVGHDDGHPAVPGDGLHRTPVQRR